MNLRWISILLSLILLSGIATSAVPQWVQPGVSATYYMISSGWKNGAPEPNNNAQIYITHQVGQVTDGETSGTVIIYNPHTGMSDTQQANCVDGKPSCLGRFWLDPNNPTESFRGEFGEQYHVMGEPSVYDAAGKSWQATMMVYQDADSGVTFSVIYDTQSGLILSYNLEYPNEKIYSTLYQTNAEI